MGRKKDSKQLREVLGEAMFRRLVDAMGGQQVYIPREIADPERDERIVIMFSEALKDGSSTMSAYQQCADNEKLTIRRVQQIVAGE